MIRGRLLLEAIIVLEFAALVSSGPTKAQIRPYVPRSQVVTISDSSLSVQDSSLLAYETDKHGILKLSDSDYLDIARRQIADDFVDSRAVELIRIGEAASPYYSRHDMDIFCQEARRVNSDSTYANFTRRFNRAILKNITHMYECVPLDVLEMMPESLTMAIELGQVDFDDYTSDAVSFYSRDLGFFTGRFYDKRTASKEPLFKLLTDEMFLENPDYVLNHLRVYKGTEYRFDELLSLMFKQKDMLLKRPDLFDAIATQVKDVLIPVYRKLPQWYSEHYLSQLVSLSSEAGRGTSLVMALKENMSTDSVFQSMDPKVRKDSTNYMVSSYISLFNRVERFLKSDKAESKFYSQIKSSSSPGGLSRLSRLVNHYLSLASIDDIHFSEKDFLMYLFKEFKPEAINPLLALKDAEGKHIMNAHAMHNFLNSGREPSEANEVYEEFGLRDNAIVYYLELGLDEDNIVLDDSWRPNALWILPEHDWNGAYHRAEAVTIYKDLNEAYDLIISVATTEEDIYGAIESIPNIHLLVLSGHGNRTSMSFGDPGRYDYVMPESQQLDLTDYEFGEHLQTLHKLAPILAMSCSNGLTGKSGINLTNFLHSRSGRPVISFTRPIGVYQIVIDQAYPLRVSTIFREKQVIYKAGQ